MRVAGKLSRFFTTGRTVQFLLDNGAPRPDAAPVPLEDAPLAGARPAEAAGGGRLEDVLPRVDMPIVRPACSLGAMSGDAGGC
jgi:hypothetical protein